MTQLTFEITSLRRLYKSTEAIAYPHHHRHHHQNHDNELPVPGPPCESTQADPCRWRSSLAAPCAHPSKSQSSWRNRSPPKKKKYNFHIFLSISSYFSTQGETTISHMLPGVGGKADYVEVALDEVDDHVLPHILLVLCRGVVPGRSIFHCTCSLVFVLCF